MNRKAFIKRKTKETQIEMKMNIDGTGEYLIETPVGFLNHMIELFAFHGLFDLKIIAKGDTQIDEHHLVEDIGIVLGEAFLKSLGTKEGINRYGFFLLPMDEVLATVAVDLSGRYAFRFEVDFKREKIGDLATELVYDFWDAFAKNAKINLFIKTEFGRNDHHIVESIFKACARALKTACMIDPKSVNTIPSTKGSI